MRESTPGWLLTRMEMICLAVLSIFSSYPRVDGELEIDDDGQGSVEGVFHRLVHVLFLRDGDPSRAHGAGEGGVVHVEVERVHARAFHFAGGLQFSYHPERVVVHHRDHERDVVLDGGGELVHVHVEGSVSRDDEAGVSACEMRAYRRPHAEAHRAQPSAGEEAAGRGDGGVVCSPLLMQPHVRGDGDVSAHLAGEGADDARAAVFFRKVGEVFIFPHRAFLLRDEGEQGVERERGVAVAQSTTVVDDQVLARGDVENHVGPVDSRKRADAARNVIGGRCGDGKGDDEVCKLLEADAVVYQRLEDLKSALHDMNPAIEQFECSCFDGQYVTGDVTEEYLAKLEAQAHASKAKPKKAEED